MLPNSSTVADSHYHHRSLSSIDHDEKLERYLDYCKNLQPATYSSNDSLSSSKSINLINECSTSKQSNRFISGDNKDDNFLLDSWLENKLQASFKQLNYILQHRHEHHTNESCHKFEDDKEFEIFFIHRLQPQEHNHYVKDKNFKSTLNLTATVAPKNQVALGLASINDYKLCTTKIDDCDSSTNPSHQLHCPHHVFPLKQPQTPSDYLTKLGSDNSESTKQKLLPTHLNKKQNKQYSQSGDHNHMEDLFRHLERLEGIISGDHVRLKNPIIDDDEESNLLCLVLTHHNSKMKRDGLLYCYPSLDNNNQSPNVNSKIYKLSTLSGMFVTLFDVMNNLQTSPCEVLSSSSIQFNSAANENFDTINTNDITTEYWISFIIENDEKLNEKNATHKSRTNKPVPIILLIALSSIRFQENDARAIAELLDHSLRIRFGSLSDAFYEYYNSHSTRIFDYLDKILSTLNTLLVTWNNDFIGSSLLLSGTYPIPRNSLFDSSSLPLSSKSRYTSLIFQHLFIDESIVFNLCKYLNDYDSLDWIDESIKFYKNGNDIEQALSEYFARCLQFGSSSTSMPIIDPHDQSNRKSNTMQSSLFTDNNHIFDLLEIELTFFSVIGSCLFYRGFFIKSHLPLFCINLIQTILFTRGILAATKHRNYYLVYFTRIYNIQQREELSNINPNKTDLFLLVIGHGHFLHCSLLQVYRFDRSGYNYFSSKRNDKTIDDECFQLPSSFAFYVFIKESFRLLHYYLNQFSLHDQLEDSFKTAKEKTRFSLLNLFRKTFKESDSSWLDKFNPFNIIRSSKLNTYEKTLNFSQINEEHKNKFMKEEIFDETNIDIVKSNRNYSISPSIDSLSNESIYTHSTIQSTSFNYGDTIHRFNKDYLPKSLICFLNIENKMETFHGPIIGIDSRDIAEQWLTIVTSEICHQINKIRETLKSTSKLEMNRRQRTRLKIIEGQSNFNMSLYQSSTKTKTAQAIRLMYDSDGNKLSGPKTNCLYLNVYILGRCDIEYLKDIDKDQIINEFYACFLTNPILESSSLSQHRYSIAKLIFGDHSVSNEQEERNRYEMDQLDVLIADLDELIQNVRMESHH